MKTTKNYNLHLNISELNSRKSSMKGAPSISVLRAAYLKLWYAEIEN